MTRKDYTALAAALNKSRPDPADPHGQGHHIAQWVRDVLAISDALAADNPRFDRDRFWQAADR